MRPHEETFWYKGKHVVTELVRTGPYVWHLTHKIYRARIAMEGILPVQGLVFANNVVDNINDMWHWDTEMECLDGSHLDYWCIDVRKARCHWYNDTNLDYYNAWGRYVCTPSPIPIEAITLFEHDDSLVFKPQEFDENGEQKSEYSLMWDVKLLKGNYEEVYIKRSEGVANCTLRQLPLKRVLKSEYFEK
jgi:hypothetical protein